MAVTRRHVSRRPRPERAGQTDDLPLLKDRIRLGVRVLFVGINPGVRSALTGHHFAGYSNRFWKLLHESGLVSEPITYLDDDRLPDLGYGITNLVARPTPGINDLTPAEYEAGRAILERKIRRHHPTIVALVGLTLARVLLPSPPHTPFTVGLQDTTLAGAAVYVLPNPSGRNAHYSHAMMREAFAGLKQYLDDLNPR